MLILDDITRLRMHREADQDALDLLRSLMSMHVTLVLIGVGIPASGLLREGHRPASTTMSPNAAGGSFAGQAATQTQRRFDLVDLDPFGYDTPEAIAAWVAHLAGIETHLRLLVARPGMLIDGPMPEYLFHRTGGIVGLLERLIEDGCALAIVTGVEQLTTDLLDEVTIDLGNVSRPAAEIPDIPAPTRRNRGRPRRNTVFDDRGTPATDAAG